MSAVNGDSDKRVGLDEMATTSTLEAYFPTPTVDQPVACNASDCAQIPTGAGVVHSDTDRTTAPNDTSTPVASPGKRRRSTRGSARLNPFKTVDDFHDFELRPGWRPGSEPGVDPTKADGGHASVPALSAPCEITVVNFSQTDITVHHLNNDNLAEFLKIPQPEWTTCRWINVNGLSWDVIQALGQHKGLHRLAIEDLMNRNRTKAEWFTTHAFIVLTLQKLVHMREANSDTESETDEEEGGDAAGSRQSGNSWLHGYRGRFRSWLRRTCGLPPKRQVPDLEHGIKNGDYTDEDRPSELSKSPKVLSDRSSSHQRRIRTLQRHHSHHWQPNDARSEYMEQNSALASKDLVVAAEQVSMFLMNDNTLISFFEHSAQDIEAPIMRRLQTDADDSILRQSCDASMLAQAVIDAIIDLAIPVSSCYQEVIGDLELDVLTGPNIKHTKKLYIMVTEINKMLSLITPITTLINALRDHKTDMVQDEAAKHLQKPDKGVIITPMTCTYLGDALDHSMLITEELNQIRHQADAMINLIFNTISAHQNESMKQLTLATIIFLPLTFLTGYFGQNFIPFDALRDGVGLFWEIAIPVLFVTVIILMRRMIWRSIVAAVQRNHIGKLRKLRRNKLKKRV